MLITDHKPFDGGAIQLASELGIKMSDGFVIASDGPGPIVFERDDGQLAIHPITQGRSSAERVERVTAFSGQALRAGEEFQPLLAFYALNRGASIADSFLQ